MRNSLLTILTVVSFVIVVQSCDSTLNIDKPKDFYKYMGGDGDQTAADMVMDTDGNIYILGSSTDLADTINNKNLGTQLYVSMINPNGDVQWEQTYGDEDNEEAKDIEILSTGDLIVLGNRTKEKSIVIYTISKQDGSETRSHFIEKTDPSVHGNTITELSDGGYMVAAYADTIGSAGAYKKGIVYRYDKSFATDPGWGTTGGSFNAAKGYDVVPVKVMQYSPSDFYIFGYSNSPLATARPGTDYSYYVQPVGAGGITTNRAILAPEPIPGSYSDERLTSVKAVPDVNGINFILAGYTSDLSGANQRLYMVKIGPNLLINTEYITGAKSITYTSPLGIDADVYPTANKGYLVIANTGNSGDDNLYLTKLTEQLDSEWGQDNGYRLFGGAGDDAAAAVIERSDGRILVLGTLVLGDLKGQHKIVLMNLNSQGMLGE